MAKSIMATVRGVCFLCGDQCPTEKHHVYEGSGRRKLSEKYGLWVWLCHNCHNEPPNGVHFNHEKDLALKARIQIRAMYVYGWTVEQFRKLFRKSYLHDVNYHTDEGRDAD